MSKDELGDLSLSLQTYEPFPELGQVVRIGSGEIEATGPDVSVGMQCEVLPSEPSEQTVRALVAGVSRDRVTLVPFASANSLRIGDRVRTLPAERGNLVGDAFAGRAVDALGRPFDGGPTIKAESKTTTRLAVLDRIAPQAVFVTGVRAIDGLLTIGYGQRLGVFAASGVGKTSLIDQILIHAPCDRAVICLVGERGREVEDLWRRLTVGGLVGKCTLVAATSDEAAPMRARAVEQALALAEHWRERGEKVLFLIDSITRFAMALREIGLIAGEPPTARAYTPNVFRDLPKIVERCGAARTGGSITAIFTVLCETDDADDPLVEVMKSLLDGHIVLSRDLAQQGHYPAIDIGRSISRMFDRLTDRPQREAAQQCRAWQAKLEDSRILIDSGLYKAGADPELDAALAARMDFNAFLRQPTDVVSAFASTGAELAELVRRYG